MGISLSVFFAEDSSKSRRVRARFPDALVQTFLAQYVLQRSGAAEASIFLIGVDNSDRHLSFLDAHQL